MGTPAGSDKPEDGVSDPTITCGIGELPAQLVPTPSIRLKTVAVVATIRTEQMYVVLRLARGITCVADVAFDVSVMVVFFCK
jgi:hypothetical protein